MRGLIASSFALVLFAGSRATAGDMSAVVKNGSLTISDSAGDDGITINQAGLLVDQFRVTPVAGTTVNGLAIAHVFTGVTKDIWIKHAHGADVDNISGITVPRDLRVTAKKLDTLSVLMTNLIHVGRDLSVDSRSNVLNVSSSGAGSTVHRDVRITPHGSGGNTVAMSPLHVLRNTRVGGTSGIDVFVVGANVHLVGDVDFAMAGGVDTYVDNATTVVGGKVKAHGNGGTKTVIVSGNVGDDVNVDCGNGDGHTVIVTAPKVGGSVRAKFGNGTNHVLTISGPDISGNVECTSKGDVDTVSFGAATLVAGDVRVKLGAGANTLNATNTVTVCGDVNFTGGAGHDAIVIGLSTFWGDIDAMFGSAPTATTDSFIMSQSSVLGDVDVKATGGVNSGVIATSIITGAVRLNVGAGGSSFLLDSLFLGGLLVQGSTDDDLVNVHTVSTVADMRFVLGSGNNQIDLDDFICGRDLVVKTGAGNDTFDATSADIVGAVAIDLGGGTNVGP